MASTKKRKKHSAGRFIAGMLVYALIVAVAVFAGCRYLWGILADYQVKIDEQQAAYELSKPDNYINRYITTFDEEHIRDVSKDFLSGLNRDIQSEEDSFAEIKALFDGEIAYNKSFASENLIKYDISCKDILLGNVSFDFDGSVWNVTSESFNFDWLLNSSSVTVPCNFSVSCNGFELDDSYIVESDIPFEILEEFEDTQLFEMPYFVTYEISEYVGEAFFNVEDFNGNVVTIPEGSGQEMFIDNCSEEQIAYLEEYVSRYIPLYIRYTSNADGNRYGNLDRLLPYLLPGSSLEARMKGALEGLYYAHSKGDTLKELTYNHHMVLGENTYFVDITYLVDTVGNAGLVTTTNNVKLIIVKNDRGSFTAAQSSY